MGFARSIFVFMANSIIFGMADRENMALVGRSVHLLSRNILGKYWDLRIMLQSMVIGLANDK